MSVDDLAIMVARGFERIEEKFEGVDGKFEGINKRLDKLEEGQVKIRRDILNLGDTFVTSRKHDELASRVYVLERKAGVKR